MERLSFRPIPDDHIACAGSRRKTAAVFCDYRAGHAGLEQGHKLAGARNRVVCDDCARSVRLRQDAAGGLESRETFLILPKIPKMETPMINGEHLFCIGGEPSPLTYSDGFGEKPPIFGAENPCPASVAARTA